MTESEKAKAYDETIARLRNMHNEWSNLETDGWSRRDVLRDLEYYVPELAESEDERIRKAIYNCVKWFGIDSCFFKDVSQEECLAWLEKQNNMGISESTKQKLEDNLHKALEKETPESWKKFLDGQGEQKPAPDWMLKFLDELRAKKNYFDWDEHRDIEGGILAIINWMNPNYFNGKDGEQKPDTQHSIEWSVSDFRTWQYIVSDVLTKKDGIGQYLDSGECKKIAKYMQEEWSKKLNIEQKHTELLKGEDYGIDGLYHAIDILERTLGKVSWYQSDDGILEHKAAITAVKKLKEQKPVEWSEEDNKMSRFIGNAITADDASEYLESKAIQVIDAHVWLDGLRDRVQPQPRQGWSEEDEQMLNDIIKDLVHPWNEYIPDRIEDEIIWLKNRLKSLRPQNTWKPSEEQINALSITVKHGCTDDKEALGELLEQLKAL